MAHDTADVTRYFERPNVKVDQTSRLMAKRFPEEVAVPREERGSPNVSQQRQDLVVLDPLCRQIVANLAQANAAGLEFEPLTLEHVLIQDDHAETVLSA
jgi:hypothetical protein